MSNIIFDEAEYLKANPDLALAVEQGIFICDYHHYIKHGKGEGRALKGLASVSSRDEKMFDLLNKKGLGLDIAPRHKNRNFIRTIC